MKLFDQIPHRDKKQAPPLPSCEEVIEALYDADPDSFPHEVVEVLYTKDRSKRYIILRSAGGSYTYRLEGISIRDEEEWQNYFSHENIFPAWWEPIERNNEKSFFGTLEECKADLYAESDYQQYFSAPCMTGQCYCPYMQKPIDEGLCYDMQMIAGGYIKADALAEVEHKKELLVYCNRCDHRL